MNEKQYIGVIVPVTIIGKWFCHKSHFLVMEPDQFRGDECGRNEGYWWACAGYRCGFQQNEELIHISEIGLVFENVPE